MINAAFVKRITRNFQWLDRSMLLLACAAAGALGFTLMGGLLMNLSTRSLASAKDWVEHTQEVLTTLQNASVLIERIDFNLRLYSLSKDDSQLFAARNSAIGLRSGAYHIATLVADNAGQAQNVKNLQACSATLTGTLLTFSSGSSVTNPVLRCRETLGLMAEQERILLQTRDARSRRTFLVSALAEGAFVVVSLGVVLLLFALLARDSILRRRATQQSRTAQLALHENLAALGERAEEARLLTSCREEIQLCVSAEQLHDAAAACMQRLLPGSSGSVGILKNSSDQIEVASTWGADRHSRLQGMFSPAACCGLRLGQLRLRSQGVSSIHCTHFLARPPARYLCIPMVAQGETLGIIYLECEDDRVYASVQQRSDGLRQLTQLTSLAVASLNLRAKLENQSIRDPLTGLFNRRFLEVVLERELARAKRESGSLAVLMLDVDHFKRFNDTHGHATGDAVLRAVAEIFLLNVRTEDTVCRYGGEEFAIILPGMPAEDMPLRAELILEAVRGLRVPLVVTASSHITVSIGIAFFSQDGFEGDVLLRKADQALYRAKHSGRDQVCFFEESLAALALLS